MSAWPIGIVVGVLTSALLAVGCANSKMLSDPFKKTGRQSYPDDPRYEPDAKDTFDRANEKARAKDVSFDDSGRPVERLAADDVDSGLPYRSVARNNQDSDQRPPSTSEDDLLPDFSDRANDGARSVTEGNTVDSIRRRLDRIGAKNIRFDREEVTGQTIFRCEMPHADNPDQFRVFEAKSPDETKAMLAVVEQAEKWAEGR